MKKIAILLSTLIGLTLLAGHAQACMDHYFYQQGQGGFFKGSNTAHRMMRTPAKEKIFKIKHPAAAVAVVEEDTNLKVNYKLPPSAKNVSLHFAATSKLELLDSEIDLTDQEGSVTARFRAHKKGVDIITVTVSGEHKGEVLTYSSKVYISAKASS